MLIFRMKRILFLLSVVMAGAFVLAACDSGAGDLAPYEGDRPLVLFKITQSFSPDIQWVGGRVAAVGVNAGEKAAFDSTLVWLALAEGDNISSHATVGEETARSRIESLGGTPLDSLAAGRQYTFWLATKEAVDAQLQEGALNEHTFLDTTINLQYEIRGRLRTRENVTVNAYRDQKLAADRVVVRWTPGDVRFRRVALRPSSSPGWEGLVWHIQTPDGESPKISSPVISDQPQEGLLILEPFPEAGLTAGVPYTLWLATDSWNSSFALNSPGLAYIQVFASSIQP